MLDCIVLAEKLLQTSDRGQQVFDSFHTSRHLKKQPLRTVDTSGQVIKLISALSPVTENKRVFLHLPF